MLCHRHPLLTCSCLLQSTHGTSRSDRGAGRFFGPDVTKAFCEANNIEFVVRSHECVPQGFKVPHAPCCVCLSQCITAHTLAADTSFTTAIVS